MKAEFVVVGAGIVGCATAYYLANRSVKVTVIEKDKVGGHASGHALGGLNPLTGTGLPDPLGPLSIESYHLLRTLIPQLEKDTGFDLEFGWTKAIHLAFSKEEETLLKQRLSWQQKQPDFGAMWLSAQEIEKLDPRISPKALGGILTENIGLVNPYLLCQALRSAAIKKGASFLKGNVQGLTFNGGQIKSVDLEKEKLPCDGVVIATGPWAGEIKTWTGFNIPIRPLKGQILQFRLPGKPFNWISYADTYAVTKPDGLVWIGTTEEEGFNEKPSEEAHRKIILNINKLFPSVFVNIEDRLVRQTACLRPVTPDGYPILGLLEGFDGLVLATGGGRKGILMGPMIGQIASDLVISGNTPFNITAMEPNREIGKDSKNLDLLRF
jgi:glycine oxidase